MALTFEAPDWQDYRMDYQHPHERVEPMEKEIEVVEEALAVLKAACVIPHIEYDCDKFLAHRAAVAELFEIPWTAITHRMQRLLYAINAIIQPPNMIAAGVFCGNTFISNAGAGVGPGAVYKAKRLVGLEIRPEEAERAERNVRKIDPTGIAEVLAQDAVPYVAQFPEEIGLLYLDADGDGGRGKGIYLEILQAGLDRMPKGSVVIAHNSVNCADRLGHYFAFVRNSANFANSVNVVIDGEGIEVSVV